LIPIISLTQNADREKERKVFSGRLESAQSTQSELQKQLEQAESKAKTIQTELDDLLLVLEEMQEKQTRYKEKIKSLGGEVTDDEEEEDE